MPMTIRFNDGREYDFDTVWNGAMQSAQENLDSLSDEDIERVYDDYNGPGGHCDVCFREYGYYCTGPVLYRGPDTVLYVCTDCKRELFRIDLGLRDEDFGVRFYGEDEDNG